MATTRLPPDAHPWAEPAALHLGQILTGLCALIAARFRILPSVALANRLNSFVNRTRQRLLAVFARIAAGRMPRINAPRPGRLRAAAAPRTALRLPRRHGWLILALPNEAVAYASQLETLLAQPGMADLIARHPTAARILAPLRRLLTVPEPPPTPPCPKPARATRPHPKPPAEPPAKPPAKPPAEPPAEPRSRTRLAIRLALAFQR